LRSDCDLVVTFVEQLEVIKATLDLITLDCNLSAI